MRLAKLVPAALAFALALVGAARAEPVKIRLAWVVPPPAELQPILFEKPGLAKHLGTSYVVETPRFAGTPQMITGLSAGEIEIAPLAYSSYGLAIENAGMDDLRVIADELQDGAEGYYSGEFMVLKDSPIKTLDDLKGKIAASNGAGTAGDMAIRALLRQHGMEDKHDYTLIEVRLPNMKAVLTERKVDLITSVLPFSYDPALREAARPLFTQKDALGKTQMIVWAARQSFLDKNRAAMADFMEDALRAIHWYNDPGNHAEVVGMIAAYSKQPRELYDSWIFTNKDYYHSPNGLPDLTALQRNIATQQELGFLKADIDVAKHSDLSFVKEAAARLASGK
ncbi:MAG TPA: ABC transporter substrate-binding protein [Stellaceae bacterium]|nr:ABC transporter substrate-binding protein [Stellaceae bacterium]